MWDTTMITLLLFVIKCVYFMSYIQMQIHRYDRDKKTQTEFLNSRSWVTSFFFPFIFISWRLVTLQYCSGFCHTLTWISRGFTSVPHPDLPSHHPLHPIPLGLPSAPALSTSGLHLHESNFVSQTFHCFYLGTGHFLPASQVSPFLLTAESIFPWTGPEPQTLKSLGFNSRTVVLE